MKEDVNVINSRLQYVNELLRNNMLNLHRTQEGHDVKLQTVLTDVLHDILQPIATILFTRSNQAVTIEMICIPQNIIVNIDPMRLKQICFNLASNACQFVQMGFIRERAEIVP
jgi:signal transduction histidine kinase